MVVFSERLKMNSGFVSLIETFNILVSGRPSRGQEVIRAPRLLPASSHLSAALLTRPPRAQRSALWEEETEASAGSRGPCGGAAPRGPGGAAGTPTRTGRLWPGRSPRGSSPSPSCRCWTRSSSGTLRGDQSHSVRQEVPPPPHRKSRSQVAGPPELEETLRSHPLVARRENATLTYEA